MSVKSLNQEFVTFKATLNRQDKTVKEYITSVERFQSYLKEKSDLSFLLEKHMTDVTYKVAQDYIIYLKTELGLAHASVRKALVGIQEYYKFLSYKEMVQVSPFAQVNIPKDLVIEEKQYMALEEGDELINAVDTISKKCSLALMVKLGLRIEEVCNVEVDKIDLNKGSMTILRKGNKMHTLPIPSSLKEVLSAQVVDSKSKGNKYLFQSPVKKDSPVTTMAIRKVFDGAVDRLGKEGKEYHPHSLRSIFGRNLRANGFALEEVQKLMNHSSSSTTLKHYLSAEDVAMNSKMANM